MSSNLRYKQAANVERRTWDKETFEAKAKSRIKAESEGNSSSNSTQRNEPLIGEKRSLAETLLNDGDDGQKEEFQEADSSRAGPMHSKRAFLKARTSKVDLESKVGTCEIINPEEAAKSSIQITDGVSLVGGSSGGVGWYCKVCDCYLKDSLTYLDHINGRKHQRALGYSMRTEKSTTQEVSSRLKALADARRNKEAEDQIEFMVSQGKDDGDDDGMNEFEKMVKKKDEDIVKRKAERAKRREERKKKAQAEKGKAKIVPQIDEEGGSDEDDNETGGLHPDMAAMMGFSSFGCLSGGKLGT